jgi:hypothetical protein
MLAQLVKWKAVKCVENFLNIFSVMAVKPTEPLSSDFEGLIADRNQ